MIGDFDKLDNRLTPPEFFTAAVFATLVHELESTAAEDRCVIFAGPKGATETMLNTGSYGLGCRLSGIRLNFDALTDNELEDLEMLLLRAGKLNLQLSPDMIAAALAELQLARQVQREHFLHAHQIDHLLVMLRADTIRA